MPGKTASEERRSDDAEGAYLTELVFGNVLGTVVAYHIIVVFLHFAGRQVPGGNIFDVRFFDRAAVDEKTAPEKATVSPGRATTRFRK